MRWDGALGSSLSMGRLRRAAVQSPAFLLDMPAALGKDQIDLLTVSARLLLGCC